MCRRRPGAAPGLLASGTLPKRERDALLEIYRRLNPADLKRRIEEKLERLDRAYNEKRKRQKPGVIAKSEVERSVRIYMIQRPPARPGSGG